MKGHDGVLNYYYDKENYDNLEPAQRCGLEIWCENGKHFKLFCAVWTKFSELMGDLTEIIGEPAEHFDFLCNSDFIHENTQVDLLRQVGKFGCIKVVAIRKPRTLGGGYGTEIKYLECYIQHGSFSFSAGLSELKTLQDYEDLIRCKLAIRKFKYYEFFDYKGNQINPSCYIPHIPALGPIRIIRIKRNQTIPMMVESIAKKVNELNEKMPKGNESDNE